MKKKPLRASMSFSPQEVAWMSVILERLGDGGRPGIPASTLEQIKSKANAMKLRIAEIRRVRDAS